MKIKDHHGHDEGLEASIDDMARATEQKIIQTFADIGADMQIEDPEAFAFDLHIKGITYTKMLSEDVPEESGYHFYKQGKLFRIVPLRLVKRGKECVYV